MYDLHRILAHAIFIWNHTSLGYQQYLLFVIFQKPRLKRLKRHKLLNINRNSRSYGNHDRIFYQIEQQIWIHIFNATMFNSFSTFSISGLLLFHIANDGNFFTYYSNFSSFHKYYSDV